LQEVQQVANGRDWQNQLHSLNFVHGVIPDIRLTGLLSQYHTAETTNCNQQASRKVVATLV